MFNYLVEKIYLNEGELQRKIIQDYIDKDLDKFLNEYERLVCDELLKIKKFKYILSSIKRNIFYEICPKFFKNHPFLLTMHPSSNYEKILNNFYHYNYNNGPNYVFTIERPLAEYWLNSRNSINYLYGALSDFNKKKLLPEDFLIFGVKIYGNDTLNFRQLNVGSKTKIYYMV